MNKILTILIAIFIGCGVNVYAQGKVTRPSQKQSQTSKSKKSTSKASTVTISEPDGYINGHGYVDLGLPSGTKWATCNVGASTPEGYGDYFAWGETSVKKKYSQENSISYKKTKVELAKIGVLGPAGNLTKLSDAASIHWEGTWRMPSESELNELNGKCTWIKCKYNGKLGAKVIGPNGKSIFLPAAGCWRGNKLFGAGEYVHIWGTSKFHDYETQETINPFILNYSQLGSHHKYCGLNVRPVSE